MKVPFPPESTQGRADEKESGDEDGGPPVHEALRHGCQACVVGGFVRGGFVT